MFPNRSIRTLLGQRSHPFPGAVVDTPDIEASAIVDCRTRHRKRVPLVEIDRPVEPDGVVEGRALKQTNLVVVGLPRGTHKGPVAHVPHHGLVHQDVVGQGTERPDPQVEFGFAVVVASGVDPNLNRLVVPTGPLVQFVSVDGAFERCGRRGGVESVGASIDSRRQPHLRLADDVVLLMHLDPQRRIGVAFEQAMHHIVERRVGPPTPEKDLLQRLYRACRIGSAGGNYRLGDHHAAEQSLAVVERVRTGRT